MTRLHSLSFVLALCFGLLVLPVAAQQPNTIDFGDTVEGALDTEHPSQAYTFAAEAGQIISITLMSDDFDPLVVLLDANGQEITYNDDGGPGSLNARIGPLALADSGQYTIVANSYANYFSFSSGTTLQGDYTLILEDVEIRRIEYTQKVKDALTNTQPTAYFQFRGQAGDVVNVAAETENFSANLSLSLLSADSTSAPLMNSSDYSGQGLVLLGGYMLPETANYLITLNSNTPARGGFALEVERVHVTELVLDEPVAVTFDDENRLSYFSFEGDAAEVISLSVTGDGALDSTLTLNSPEGYQIAYSDDVNERDPAIINQLLPQTGIYTVILQPYSAGSAGDVTLLLEQGRLLSLDDGPQRLTMGHAHPSEMLTLNGSAGEVVRLVIELEQEATVSPSVSIRQGDAAIAYASGATIQRLAVDFVIPAPGLVYVQIEEYSNAELGMTVSAERLSEPGQPPAAPTPTPTPATLPTELSTTEEAEMTETPAATEDSDGGLIDSTEEPLLPPIPTGEATEVPTADTTEVVEPEATEAAG